MGQKFNPYYNFKQLNVQNGLAQNIVYHFLQDSRGYIWIGTRNGITRFDGIRTINFQHSENNSHSLGGNFITGIFEDSNHVIWIGNDAGIDRFNPEENDFTHYPITMADGHSENSYCVLLGFSLSHDLWLIDTKSTAIKIFNTRSAKFKTIAQTEAVDGLLHFDSTKNKTEIWTYLSISTIHLTFSKDSLIARDKYFDGAHTNEPSLLIYHVYFQEDSVVWLSSSKGILRLNPKTRNYKTYNSHYRETVNEIRCISASPKGLLWAGTGGSGIYTFDPKAEKFVDHFSNYALDRFSICSNNIVSLYFDKSGNIWCGSYGNGVSYAHVESNSFIKALSKEEMDQWKKENNVSWLGVDSQHRIWCILQNAQGLWLLDSSLQIKEFRWPAQENGQKFVASIYQIFFDNNSSAWCMTDRGLFLYNTLSNTVRQMHYPKITDALFGSYWTKMMIRLHDSSLLFSTFGGLYRIRSIGGKYTIQPFSPLNEVPFKSFDEIFEDSDHEILVRDIGETLYVLAPAGSGGEYSIKKKIPFKPELLHFQEFGSDIFMATSNGLYVLHKKSLEPIPYNFNSSMPLQIVNDLLIEKDQYWLFGDKGLYFYNVNEKAGRLFTIEDGLPSNEFSECCKLIQPSGNCIIATNNGLLAFNPATLADSTYPPRAQLINMYVNDSGNSFISNPQERTTIRLNHDQNTFSFDFSCINFQHADETLYEYKLDGYDEKWIRNGFTHYTRYSRIAPGTYTFRLRLLDASGKLSPYQKNLTIEIKKAFWQTTIFRILLGLLAAIGVWQLIKWYLASRIRKQRAEFERRQAIEKERTRIATDMHDELGAGLSRIKFLSETIGMKKQMQQPIEEDVSNIGEYANEMISKMGEIVWALNEKNDSLSDLLSYTRAYAAEYMLQNGISCKVNMPSAFPVGFVSGEFRRNIYLTIKEALHNIVKHAQARQVMIDIRSDKQLSISIKDDGIGFDPGHTRPFSNGLNNMKKRMNDIGGSLNIFTNGGTTILITAPLAL